MAISPSDVDAILSDALPEFRRAVEDHRQQWRHEPMLYPLVADLFRFVDEMAPQRERLAFAKRAYEVTDRMLLHGEPSVRDCFSIEMIEPLWGDPQTTDERFPGLESVLGPAAQRDLAAKREWVKRHQEAEVITRRDAMAKRDAHDW
jgi:hypothetical protein